MRAEIVDIGLRWVLVVLHSLGLYGAWHRLRRRFEDTRGYPDVPEVADVDAAIDLVEDMDRKLWRRDSARVFFDLISDPRRWFARRVGLVDTDTDCDEAATALWAMLKGLIARQRRLEDWIKGGELQRIYLLQVVYRAPRGALLAHHVCAFYWRRRWWHGGNQGLRAGLEGPRTGDLGLEALAQHVAGVRHGGRVVVAHVCENPRELRGWRRIA